MKWPYRYDVAISVAEEDRAVADALVPELKKQRIGYYYYGENNPNVWGEDIIKLTIRNYGRRSRFVLLITSKTSVQKYWASIELKVALSVNKNILQLRADDSPVDERFKDTIYRDWKDNPAEIAADLKYRIRRHKRKRGEPLITTVIIPVVTLVLFSLIYYFFVFWLRPVPPVGSVLVTREMPSGKSGEIVFHDFYIGSTEVTIAEYSRFCESVHRSLPPQPPNAGANSPVRNITWYEAQAFCEWVKGRLPTEAEWKYAAGYGATKYSGGGSAALVAVYDRAKPAVVRSRKPNDLGIYDMSGNVAEWCNDWSDESKKWKMVKGGAYNSSLDELAVESEAIEHPEERRPEIGFRVVWDK